MQEGAAAEEREAQALDAAGVLEALAGVDEARVALGAGAAGSKAAKKKTRTRLRRRAEALEARLAALPGGGALRAVARGNYVAASCPGCHVAHREDPAWVVGSEQLEEGMFGPGIALSSVPDMSIDPETGLLSLVNASSTLHKCFNISVGGACLPVRDSDGAPLAVGESRDAAQRGLRCVSLVVLLRPRTVMDVCFLSAPPGREPPSEADADADYFSSEEGFLVSDVKTWDGYGPLAEALRPRLRLEPPTPPTPPNPPPNPAVLGFPLASSKPVLCSQGCGGHFTHFFPANFFAVDLECEPQTPVVAIADGEVTEVRDSEAAEGIMTSNLFRWNSLTLRVEAAHAGGAPLWVEYVHIARASAVVGVGDRVTRGQLLCRSGCVGFSPRPHLHLQAAREAHHAALAVPFLLRCREVPLPRGDAEAQRLYGDLPSHTPEGLAALEPRAGRWYVAAEDDGIADHVRQE